MRPEWTPGRKRIEDSPGRSRTGSEPSGPCRSERAGRSHVERSRRPSASLARATQLGIDAPVSAVVRNGDAIVGIANEFIDHAGTLGRGKLPKGRSKEVLRGFSADVWLANWDAVGLELDNVVKARKT